MSKGAAIGSRKLVVACDLFRSQRLYRVPAWALRRLRARGIVVRPFDLRGAGATPAAEVYWGNYFEEGALGRLPGLRWIHCASVGVNRACTPAVAARGIAVTNSRGILTAPVAASVMALLCGLARGLHHAGRLRGAGRLDRDSFEAHFDEMRDLEGELCLIAGLGDIGSRVAAACAALGMRVWGIRAGGGKPPRGVERILTLRSLASAAARADFVVNLLPLTPLTRRVFDDRVFARMKRTAYFINAGRGPTVDEKALARGLARGRPAGAGLDVFEAEPLPSASPLWSSPRTLLTPHIACLSGRYWPRQIELLELNADRYRAGRPLLNRIDLRKGY